jgi:hypothetical protein
MKLYFNGCSHTWGDDLENPSAQSWPALIANQLNCEFVNDSARGGSNDRIMYRTIKHIDQFDKFYIAWTFSSRFTRYRSDNNHEVNFNSRLTHLLYGNEPDFKTYGQIHYRIWHNELYNFKIWLQNIILLQSLFKLKNKRYVMLNTDNNLIDQWSVDGPNFNDSIKSLVCFDAMNDEQLLAEHKEIQLLLSQIDYSNFVGWNNWWLTLLTTQYPTGETGHLLEAGHQAIANYILQHDSY